MSDASILIGMTIGLIAITAACLYLPLGFLTAAAHFVIARLRHGDRKAVTMDADVWPQDWPHDRPDHPLSPEEAHQILSSPQHYDCGPECARKSAALDTVTDEGVQPR
jgi:hypothetical protein